MTDMRGVKILVELVKPKYVDPLWMLRIANGWS